MCEKRVHFGFTVCSLILLLLVPIENSFAFYSWQTENHTGEVRGLLRVYGLAVENPEDNFFFNKKRASGIGESARLIVEGRIGTGVDYDINLLQSYVPSSLLTSRVSAKVVERSDRLSWQSSEEDFFQLDVDRLNLHWSHGSFDLTLGRQTINLATTFYFTPNDFFAPFAAQTFYRVYKPGVDAARAEISLGALSQLSLISVLGYEPESGSDTGWSRDPDSDRTSYLGRLSTVYRDIEWALLAGRVQENYILGGSMQGELFDWLGIRAEGHIAKPREGDSKNRSEVSLGLEHRWENSLEARLELFYHGSGADSVSKYATQQTAANSSYLARRYTALGLSYEFTPLLLGEGVLITNHTDHSQFLSINAVYSLADEAELVFNLGLPFGDSPEGAEIKTEFGAYPYSVGVEVRAYF